ncbi:MAG: ATP-binding protein [Desulfobacterales bacterium]|nr:ATP-binding protein [Desulfobacterales bacterium]
MGMWKDKSITTKYGIGISLLFLVVLLVAVTGCMALFYVRTVENAIGVSREIQNLVLEMDRGMGKSRHLHGGFFLNYPRIGLQKAHEIYAQSAVQEISKVVSISEKLGKNLGKLDTGDAIKTANVDFNLYLSSAKRFADTSIASFELVTELATPETGLEAQLDRELSLLQNVTDPMPELLGPVHEMEYLIGTYRLKRKRHIMQSALNKGFILDNLIQGRPDTSPSMKKDALAVLSRIKEISGQILDIDAAIEAKFKDFFLQERIVRSVSDKLIHAADQEVHHARKKINVAYRLAWGIMIAVTLTGLILAGFTAWVLNTNITQRIVRLTRVAEKWKDGKRGVRAQEDNMDELGRLGRTFNFMAGRLHRILDNLEDEVSRRTAELKDANTSLKSEISERKQAEDRFRMAAEATSDLIYEWDIQTDTLTWFGDIDSALGYPPHRFPRTIDAWVSRIHPDDMDTLKDAVEYHRSSTRPIKYEYRIRKQDGTWRNWYDHGVPVLTDAGIPQKWIGTCTDITEMKQHQAEKQKLADQLRQSQKMEAIGTLAGGIAHEFNNILGIIIGNTELALDAPSKGQARDAYITAVQKASFRAKEIVHQLLSFSRKTEQQQKTMDISPVVQEALTLIRSSIPSNIEIRSHIPESCDTIQANATQIHQVIINVCTNAAHAMADKGGILTVNLSRIAVGQERETGLESMPPGTYIKIEIQDTGIGIKQKYREKIFDPYFTTKAVGKGTGMGLSVVHGIVKNHNGHISVESQAGNGTTITIFFPVVSGETDEQPVGEKKKPQGQETILFVDDESALVEIARESLKGLGYKVVGNTSPLEALADFENSPHRFDLVISDMTMPGMSGVTLAEKLKAVRKDIPIIICTGNSAQVDERDASVLGISALANKPITMGELSELAREVLDR